MSIAKDSGDNSDTADSSDETVAKSYLGTWEEIFHFDEKVLVTITQTEIEFSVTDEDGEESVDESFTYIATQDGSIIYVEGVGIKHLNGYQDDDKFTDSNLVITDNR